MDIDNLKQIAEQMPESPEKRKALQAYLSLKTFEAVAEPFESEVEKAWKRLAQTGSHRNLQRLNRARRNAR